MRVFKRFFALLVFSALIFQSINAQSVTSQLSVDHTIVAQESATIQHSYTPQVDIYELPGNSGIHVRVEGYRPSAQISVGIFDSQSRLVRQEIGAVCTICGTFDIDIDEELSQGVYRVVVVADRQVVTRHLYVK